MCAQRTLSERWTMAPKDASHRLLMAVCVLPHWSQDLEATPLAPDVFCEVLLSSTGLVERADNFIAQAGTPHQRNYVRKPW